MSTATPKRKLTGRHARHDHRRPALRRALLWAVLVLFHPNPTETSPFEGIRGRRRPRLVIHVGQLILAPFVFLAVWRLLDGLHSTAATVSRCALVVWAVFFSAYDTVQGNRDGATHPPRQRSRRRGAGRRRRGARVLVNDSQLGGNISVLALLGQGSWIVVAIAPRRRPAQSRRRQGRRHCDVLSVLVAIHIAPAAGKLRSSSPESFVSGRDRRQVGGALWRRGHGRCSCVTEGLNPTLETEGRLLARVAAVARRETRWSRSESPSSRSMSSTTTSSSRSRDVGRRPRVSGLVPLQSSPLVWRSTCGLGLDSGPSIALMLRSSRSWPPARPSTTRGRSARPGTTTPGSSPSRPACCCSSSGW